jgi:hypothetical protein
MEHSNLLLHLLKTYISTPGKYANYGVYPDQPPPTYTTYAVPKDGYGSYGKEESGKKVARSAEDYGTGHLKSYSSSL